MPKLTSEDVLKLAQLARLELSPDEVHRFKQEIGAILHYVEQLQAVDVSDITPTYQVNDLNNVMRPDVVKNYGASPQELLKNAPSKEDGHIKVKRVLQ